MILEGILTTCNADGSVNVAPMGPIVDAEMRRLVLRPFQTATTFANLCRTRQAVFHVTDDVEMLARAAVGPLDPLPALTPAPTIEGWILSGACRWYALAVSTIDAAEPRARIAADVVERGTLREYFGLNRAKHAVLEAAILATRVEILAAEEIVLDFARLAPLVEKTGGAAERRAFAFLEDYVQAAIRAMEPA